MKRNIKNQKGSLTLSFIFSFVIVMGLFWVFFSIGLTLQTIYAGQYVSFQTARAGSLGHATEQIQKEAGESYFNNLLSTGLFGKVFKKGKYFKLSNPEVHKGAQPNDVEAVGRKKYYGAKVEFESLILKNLNVPFLGKPSLPHFKANLRSFIDRQPSSNECINFNKDRWKAIQSIFGLNIPESSSPYEGIADNGC